MAKGYVIYNPLAGNGCGEENARLLDVLFDDELEYYDMTRITNYGVLLHNMQGEDHIIIAGGDGTLNRFINDTKGLTIRQEILYFPIGTENDFAHELGKELFADPFPITKYLQRLPSVQVKGINYRFLNGVGFGIDGYCCQVADELRRIPGRKVNDNAIAFKGLLFRFNTRNAKVTVDGKEHTYKKVWLAPTMHGRCYGGGMIPAPEQDRLGESGKLSLMLLHGAGRLKTLCVFPGIFKGKHVKHTHMVAVHTGYEITVEFDRPTPLQLDGEIIPDVTSYIVRAPGCNAKHAGIYAAASKGGYRNHA